MRFRYSQRPDSKPGDRHYDVRAQEKPRGRWQPLGWVMGLSSPGSATSWAGLREGADAWTEWKKTRGAAAQDMADGRTFRTPMQERIAAETQAALERMREEAHAGEARWRQEHFPASGPSTDMEAQ